VAECPRRESEHPVTVDAHGVLSLHVGPPLTDLGVLAAIDLDVNSEFLEICISVPPVTGRIGCHDLSGRRG
jgi:hypothetical protein